MNQRPTFRVVLCGDAYDHTGQLQHDDVGLSILDKAGDFTY